MESLLWLGAPGCDREDLVGGKAASLSRLAQAYRVPPGFAIPALSPSMSESVFALRPLIAEAYRELTERTGVESPALAVRSSAVDEDGSGSSFAGQHETFLNVRGVDATLDAIARCVRSAASAEASAYRRMRNLSLEDVQIAVLVQQLIEADVSAVVFSVNPVSGDRGEIMITSNWGLGESIVGGTATPDTFTVRKSDLAITWRQIARKRDMTVMTPEGTVDSAVPDHLQLPPSLSDAHIIEVARLAQSLEVSTGVPVDVECAFGGGQLYLLQCRPVTTLH